MFDPTSLAAFGLPALFAVALLAGSIVPLPSEAVLVALIAGGVDWSTATAVATAGNLLGAWTLYWLGGVLVQRPGGVVQRWAAWVSSRTDHTRSERALAWLRRWGPGLLLLSWLPVVGDLLVFAAGTVGIRRLPFLVLTGMGKAVRFAAVAYAARAVVGV